MSEYVLVRALRRITLTFLVNGNVKAQSITCHPKKDDGTPKVTRVPPEIWKQLLARKGSPRKDGTPPKSPLEEYLDAGLLWTVTADHANQIHEGTLIDESPRGPEGAAYRPEIREPESVDLAGTAMLDKAILETEEYAAPAE